MNKTTIIFALSLLASASVRLFATPSESYPPKIPNFDGIPSTISAPIARKLVLGALNVELEHTTLEEVMKSIGTGKIQHQGDAGDSQYWLCFTAPLDLKSRTIWISSSELGGSQHIVDGIFAREDKHVSKVPASCPDLPVRFRSVSLDAPVWFGSSKKDLVKRFGEPSKRTENWWFYSYLGRAPIEGFDESAILGVRFVNGLVVEVFASKTTTN